MEGIFPKSCTIANGILLYKKDDKTNLTTYRPISILSRFSKILERQLYFRFTKYFSKHKVLYEAQYGFKQYFYNSCRF